MEVGVVLEEDSEAAEAEDPLAIIRFLLPQVWMPEAVGGAEVVAAEEEYREAEVELYRPSRLRSSGNNVG
jgi:hypothetical protein